MRAVKLLQEAYDRSLLSLDTLCRVHASLIEAPPGIGGRLRDGPAVVRLNGRTHFVPPPAADAHIGAEAFVRTMRVPLSTGDPEAAVVLAADSAATLLDLHPFADGNGRLALALSAWLLLRVGYLVKPDLFLAEVCHIRRQEYFRTLRNHGSDPWAWRRFFGDAVLICFDPPSVG